MQLFWVLLHGRRVQDLSVVLACLKVLVIVLGQGNLLLIEAQLEVCDIVVALVGRSINDGRSVLASRSEICDALLLCLFRLFCLFLKLLLCLGFFPAKVSCADLATENLCLYPVVVLYAKCHLFEDKLSLLSTRH